MALAPIGVQSIVHPDGELAVARAAAAVGLTMTLSTVSSFALEEVAEAAGGPKWFQLYWPRSRELAASLIGRAEQAGYEAIVLTVDTFLPGWKPRDLQVAWQPQLEGTGIANYTSDPVFRSLLDRSPEDDPQAAIGQFVDPVREPGAQLGRPRVPARGDRAPGPDQGHPAPRGRARRARPGDRRRDRLQPRRPPGRRRDRRARRPAGGRGRRRRRSRGAPRQRRALGRGRGQGARAGRRRGAARAALHLGPGARWRGRGALRPAHDARRARPDARPQRPHADRRGRAGAARPRGRGAGLRAPTGYLGGNESATDRGGDRRRLDSAGVWIGVRPGADRRHRPAGPGGDGAGCRTGSSGGSGTGSTSAGQAAPQPASASTSAGDGNAQDAGSGSQGVDAAASAEPPAPKAWLDLDIPRDSYPVIWVRRGHRVEIRTEPGGGELVDRAGKRTEFGSPNVFGVIKQSGHWAGVSTPLLANGQLGWIRLDPQRLNAGWTHDLDRRRHLRSPRRAARGRRRSSAASRSPSARPAATRRPGRYAITDTFRGDLNPAYGCCALALSATQPNLPSGWLGGSRIAIHGTTGPLGIAASHGCVRAADADVSALVNRVPLGTPGLHPRLSAAAGGSAAAACSASARSRSAASSSMSASSVAVAREAEEDRRRRS